MAHRAKPGEILWQEIEKFGFGCGPLHLLFWLKNNLNIVRGLALAMLSAGDTLDPLTESAIIFWMTPVSLNQPRHLPSMLWKNISVEIGYDSFLHSSSNLETLESGLFLGTTNEVWVLKSNSLPKWYSSLQKVRKILGFMVVYLPSLSLLRHMMDDLSF